MSFKDKVVIVTGSSSGIGAATAKLFAKEGAKVTLVGRNVEKLKKVEKECEKLSGSLPLTLVVDISKGEGAKIIVEKTVEHYGKLDILVNNAGISSFCSVLDTNFVSEFDRIMATNLRAVVISTTTALPYLIQSKGNIINVSSIGATCPMPVMPHYCASKAALNHFSRSIAMELAPKGVRVNVVSPGPVKTDIIETYGLKMSQEQLEIMAKSTPLGFISTAEELGELILYLASEKARSVTGSTYVMDVGASLQGMNRTGVIQEAK